MENELIPNVQFGQQPADPLLWFSTASTCKESLQVQTQRNCLARSWPGLTVSTSNLKEPGDGL